MGVSADGVEGLESGDDIICNDNSTAETAAMVLVSKFLFILSRMQARLTV